MSYHRALGAGPLPPMTPTQLFAQAVDPHSWRFSPPGAVFAPYGWGPDFNIGMPMSYTHHIGYEKTPIPGARRNLGPYYDVLPGVGGSWSGSMPGGSPYATLAGVMAVL